MPVRHHRNPHYLAGAAQKATDTEDIAYKANEIAPGRFTWRKYKDQINLALIYKHLWDLTKADKGDYITGTEKEGWLTATCKTWARGQSLLSETLRVTQAAY